VARERRETGVTDTAAYYRAKCTVHVIIRKTNLTGGDYRRERSFFGL